MNGYKLLADSYRKAAQDGSCIQKDAEKMCKTLDFLAECDQEDIYNLFDSSAFNTIFKGYVQKIMDELCDDDDDEVKEAAENLRSRVNGKAEAILDRMGAKYAEDYYCNH